MALAEYSIGCTSLCTIEEIQDKDESSIQLVNDDDERVSGECGCDVVTHGEHSVDSECDSDSDHVYEHSSYNSISLDDSYMSEIENENEGEQHAVQDNKQTALKASSTHTDNETERDNAKSHSTSSSSNNSGKIPLDKPETPSNAVSSAGTPSKASKPNVKAPSVQQQQMELMPEYVDEEEISGKNIVIKEQTNSIQWLSIDLFIKKIVLDNFIDAHPELVNAFCSQFYAFYKTEFVITKVSTAFYFFRRRNTPSEQLKNLVTFSNKIILELHKSKLLSNDICIALALYELYSDIMRDPQLISEDPKLIIQDPSTIQAQFLLIQKSPMLYNGDYAKEIQRRKINNDNNSKKAKDSAGNSSACDNNGKSESNSNNNNITTDNNGSNVEQQQQVKEEQNQPIENTDSNANDDNGDAHDNITTTVNNESNTNNDDTDIADGGAATNTNDNNNENTVIVNDNSNSTNINNANDNNVNTSNDNNISESNAKANESNISNGKISNPSGVPVNDNIPLDKTSKTQKRSDAFYVLEWEDEDIANELTFLSCLQLSVLQNNEFLGGKFMKKDKKVTSPTVVKISQHFDSLIMFVIQDILSYDHKPTRGKLIEKWINISYKCREMNNFNDSMAIKQALTHFIVQKLKKSWKFVAKPALKLYDELNELYSCDGNYRNLREELKRCEGTPFVPYLGILLRDINFFEEKAKYTKDKTLINFEKLMLVQTAMDSFYRYKSHTYDIQQIDQLAFFTCLLPIEEEELEELGNNIEPEFKLYKKKKEEKRFTKIDELYFNNRFVSELSK